MILSALIIAFIGCAKERTSYVTIMTRTGEIGYRVELARTPAEQSRGLQGRTELPDGHGMLFVFDPPRPVAFWMKDTLIPLDMLFAAPNGSIEKIVTATPCAADPCPRYPSEGPVAYVLEIPGGASAAQGIAVGDRLSVVQDY